MNFSCRYVTLGLTLILALALVGYGQTDPNTERRINALITRMTLAEKLGQLQQLDSEGNGSAHPEEFEMARQGLLGSTLGVRGAKFTNDLQRAALQSRLKIPILFGFDVIHGYRTLFPIPLALSSAWDPQMVEQDAAIAAAEARSAGVQWTFAPMVDIARDPRWGRIMEGAGEDPYLGSLMASAYVRGFQGTDMSRSNKVMACAKHFAAYGAAEAGRDYNTVDMSERRFRSVYLPPFKAAKDAGVGTFMTAFDDFNGVPSTANPFLLKEILRKEWGFDGFVVSDYTAVKELEPHGLAADDKQAGMYALNAGTEMDMMSRIFVQNGEALVKEGKVSMATIDNAVRDILRAKFRLGLFDNPFVDETLEAKTIKKPEFLAAAKEAAIKSFVLLKNDHDTLPIRKDIRSIAVIGSLAADKANTLDWWAGDAKADDSITILEGIRQKASSIKVNYAPGCDLTCTDDSGTAEAVRAAKESDFIVIVAGEIRDVSGEAASRSNIDLPGKQLDLIKAIHATGKPYVVVLKNGRPLTINWIAENSPAILETWHSGTMGGAAVADVLFGDANPGGKLTATFPRSVGQIPIYYAHKNTGRPIDPNNRYTSKYLDIPNTPLYPFGYGLSYTHFAISDLKLDRDAIAVDGTVKVGVAVRNTGTRSGDEVVQLYVHKLASEVTRPVRELKGFKRIGLQPGETKRVELTLTPKELSELDRDLKPRVEPGQYTIFVGDCSDADLSADLYVGVPAPSRSASGIGSPQTAGPSDTATPTAVLSASDTEFIDDLERRSFLFFWEHSDPITGLTLDRSRTTGEAPKPGDDHFQVASIAATGFALSSLCAAADHKWVSQSDARQRARNTLDFLADRAANKNGWFYHWMDAPTGERRWNSEISSIDTALLLGGVLTVRQCFGDDPNIKGQADKIYERVDFGWMLNGDKYLLSHGWRPESGWIPNRWHDYSEEMILYLLAIGSPTHPIDPESWYKWTRTFKDYKNYHYLAAVPPLFIHQFSHAWVDFRGRREDREPHVNYFDNSITATRAQREFFIDVLSKKFPTYSANIWGLTASDYAKGYIAWGAPPADPATDGTVVPCAPAGSLMFTPDISLAALKEMKAKYGDRVYGKYGFADAFNPKTGWVDSDVIGIDLGITLLSAENLRSGKNWYWFMLNPEIRRAMDLVGLHKS